MDHPSVENSRKKNFLLLLGALGVVFGDIGTSPLYALHTSFKTKGLILSTTNILGITSLVLWTLLIVVSIKYVMLVLRADHKGEGGILALTTLADQVIRSKRGHAALGIFGILGAALLYSDGIITPAISVLSAVEGLKSISPVFSSLILPITLVILTLLFSVQKNGTGKLSVYFGPIIWLWFTVLALLGLRGIIFCPQSLWALNPYYAFQFLINNQGLALSVLGASFLALTGAEVLYADIGHFGKKSIRIDWWVIVFPALILNYLGQASLLLGEAKLTSTLFYSLAPKPLLFPLIILATIATIIASQAVISGMFSLARQAMHLNYWPRLRQIHTSGTEIGQVYLPFINFMLFLGTILLVIEFKESENLAAAYGISISATMLLTTILLSFVSWHSWKHGRIFAVGILIILIPLDLIYLWANATKISHGGWIIILICLGLYIMMSTWQVGKRYLQKQVTMQSLAIPVFIKSLELQMPQRVPGTAIYITTDTEGTPRSLLHNFKHNKILHETTVLLSIQFHETPYADPTSQQCTHLGMGIYRIQLNYGFFETPNIPKALAQFTEINSKVMQITYFLDRITLIISARKSMYIWRKKIFKFLTTNALEPSEYYQLPANRVIEIGMQAEI